MELSDVVNTFTTAVVSILVTMVTAATPILLNRWFKKLGLEVDEKQRAQLVSAINNGIAFAAEKAKTEVASRTVPRAQAIQAVQIQVEAARGYVQDMAPAAVKYFKLDVQPDKLDKKILSQLAPSPQAGATAMIVPTEAGKDKK